MLTGFHGMHVTLGAIMLTVIWFRCAKGHFTHDNHFGFEAVAWYWHFVDVVWLGLFVFVYVLVAAGFGIRDVEIRVTEFSCADGATAAHCESRFESRFPRPEAVRLDEAGQHADDDQHDQQTDRPMRRVSALTVRSVPPLSVIM